MAQQAYPKNTLRAWRADWSAFRKFCAEQHLSVLPASPHTVRAYVQHCTFTGKKSATVRRYLATIARVHLAAELLSPCASEPVRLALKEMTREQPTRQRQARALGWAEINQFLETAGKGIRADRERALLCVAYDTMARRSELIALDLEDITFAKDGTGTALIRRSKTDQAGEGHQAYLARETVKRLRQWLKAGKVTEGAIFRRLVGRNVVGPRLSVDMVSDIYKRVGRWIKLSAEEVAQLSGHSIRVGAAQDLLTLNIDLASVMQAGRWKSTHMPMRYGEHVLAARGGMARAASEQRRT
jgi:site-specific recombinase XerD